MPITFDPRREPDAGKAHVRICAGGEDNPRPYRDRFIKKGTAPVRVPLRGRRPGMWPPFPPEPCL